MKKVSAFIGALTISMASFAQQGIVDPTHGKAPYTGSVKKQVKAHTVSKTAGGAISQRMDPGFSVLSYRGQITNGTVDANNIGTFVAPVYMDSTVKQSFQASGTTNITSNKLGMTFDPQSIVYDINFVDPLFDKNDIYYLDTVWIGGVYRNMIHPSTVDTLIVEVVWGDTANAAVYTRFGYNSSSPLSAWGRFACPVFGNSSQHGDVCYLSAPTTNKMTFRRAITPADTAALTSSGYIPVVLNGSTGLQLSGSDLVSVMYTYKPGSTVAAGSVVYNGAGNGPDAQTENGFSGLCFQQINPALTSSATSYANYFDDPIGKNYGLTIIADQRYGTLTGGNLFNTTALPEFVTAYWVDFSIHGTSTVGIKNYNSDILALGQNVPNPSINGTTINYSLKTDAKDVKFSVTDMMGREIYTEAIGSKSTGVYSVNLNTANFAAGVYYYSLQVDGAVATKKMIINK